ncbi:MAG: TolC family protein [Candidatus Saccharibacteria bacterium]
MDIIKNRSILLLFLLLSIGVKAQDTLKINIIQADSLFLRRSYALLASSMNIEAQKAQLIQARLYPNPIFTTTFNAYDPENKKIFHAGQGGEKAFQVEQLILLGGKRKSQVEMAKTNTAIAELEFEQLVQNLRYQLHSNLYSEGLQEVLLHKYTQQLTLLDSLMTAYQAQADKGNIALKELVRLKGAYLKLNNDRAELYNEYFTTQSNIQKILQVQGIVKFQFYEKDISQYLKTYSIQELQAIASTNRPDLLIMQQNNILAAQYLQYQKKLAVPDISLMTGYDQRGGVFLNEIQAGISIPLPLWNRNKGEIKSAGFKLQETGYQQQALQNDVNSDIQNALAHYQQSASEYQKASRLYNQDFETTIKGMTDNFQKRNVSIVEFIDFFEAYNEALTEITRIKTQLVSSAEEINLMIGKDIY